MLKFRNAVFAVAFCAAIPMAMAKPMGIGTPITPAQFKSWDIDVRADGAGLPPGHGTSDEGQAIYGEQCAACHGDFGEGAGKFPMLIGGAGTLASDNPQKTIGSYWPYATTLFDYIKRAMPFNAPKQLSDDQVYALVAFLLNQNDIVKDPGFAITDKNLASIKMPNADGFVFDDRLVTDKAFWNLQPCMSACKADVTITARAKNLGVTPTTPKSAQK